MFWDHVAWIYDVFANGVNRKANRALCAAVEAAIHPGDDVLECACGTGLLSGVIAGKCKSLVARTVRTNSSSARKRNTPIAATSSLNRQTFCSLAIPPRALTRWLPPM